MVHALKEARRVVKQGGFLIDLRPGAVHRRIGISREGRWKQLGVMHEPLGEDRAANRAVLKLVRDGLLKRGWRTRFDCPREMDTLDHLVDWIDEFAGSEQLPSYDSIFGRVEQALKADKRVKIVVRGPLVLQVLTRAKDSSRENRKGRWGPVTV